LVAARQDGRMGETLLFTSFLDHFSLPAPIYKKTSGYDTLDRFAARDRDRRNFSTLLVSLMLVDASSCDHTVGRRVHRCGESRSTLVLRARRGVGKPLPSSPAANLLPEEPAFQCSTSLIKGRQRRWAGGAGLWRQWFKVCFVTRPPSVSWGLLRGRPAAPARRPGPKAEIGSFPRPGSLHGDDRFPD